MNTATGFTIGQIASRTGISVQALIHYERKGVIPPPPRTDANHRRYPPEAIRRVRFVKSAQALGFRLSEIRDLLALTARRDATCNDIRDRVQQKIASIDEKVSALATIRQDLARLVEQCPGEAPVSACPIVDSLANGGAANGDAKNGAESRA
jgi:DNA-binding transcriptional MerR regulator